MIAVAQGIDYLITMAHLQNASAIRYFSSQGERRGFDPRLSLEISALVSRWLIGAFSFFSGVSAKFSNVKFVKKVSNGISWNNNLWTKRGQNPGFGGFCKQWPRLETVGAFLFLCRDLRDKGMRGGPCKGYSRQRLLQRCPKKISGNRHDDLSRHSFNLWVI